MSLKCMYLKFPPEIRKIIQDVDNITDDTENYAR